MKKIILLFILFLFSILVIFSSSLSFDFKSDFVQIRFQDINIKNISKNRHQKTITLISYERLDEDFKVIDYKIIKTVRIYDNKIKIQLRKNRNYLLENESLIIFYNYPQNGIVSEEVVEVFKKAKNNSDKVTEILMGTYIKILKSKNDYYYVEIPEQSNYRGWVQEKKINLLTKHKIKKEFNKIVHKKWIDLHTDSGKIKLSAGTKYKIIDDKANKILIELPTGLKGWVSKNNIFQPDASNNILAIRDKIINTSKKFLGVPYKWGGTSSNGLDCSGFIYLVFKINGISIPRDSTPQYKFSKNIQIDRIKKGDLIFFQTYKRGPSHVGIYLGDKRFIHASTNNGVIISNLNQKYYSKRFYGAGRIVQ
ncbi:MAG: NlpC/P60 family protein [Candidatus Mcinerneyibacterium aminivorans]|uniref:NlpC/P60 family protein n=1 Tax=Candidatus Mcinerneyibacterium aminivorans TaxID=2703815 RepID=A0A5D0MHD9_9BACT|nr:MAG: NlpC/P60 family protein [Candidatus Mcinerneyibacterium aminivorans]